MSRLRRATLTLWAFAMVCCASQSAQQLEPTLRPLKDLAAARTLLEQSVPGMSGAGSTVEAARTLEELEANGLRQMKECAHCPQVPFGYMNEEWLRFRRQVRAGDSVVHFRNSDANWNGRAGAEGYAILRDGTLVDVLVVSVS